MCFRGNNNGGKRRDTSEHAVFHDVNSILYTAYPMAGILLKVINVFRSENLALFTVTSSHCIRKSTKKKQKLRNKMEPKMESNRKFKTQTGEKTEKSSF